MSSHWSHCTWHKPHRERPICQVTGHTGSDISPTGKVPIVKSLVRLDLTSAPTGKVPIVKSLVTLDLASAPQGKYQLSSHWSHWTWHQPHRESTNCQVTGQTGSGISPTGKVPIVKSLVTLDLTSAPQRKYQLSSHWSHWTWHQPHRDSENGSQVHRPGGGSFTSAPTRRCPGMFGWLVGWLLNVHRLVGLVVKASASSAEGLGFESRLRRDFFRGGVIPVSQKLALQWLPCQAPGVIGSALGLVGPVSVYCDWVR